MSLHGNLLGPEPTRLPVDPAAAELAAGADPVKVAAAHPASSAAWATLAEAALDDGRARHRVRLRPHRLPPGARPAAPRRLEGLRVRSVVARAQPWVPARAGGAAPRRRGDR